MKLYVKFKHKSVNELLLGLYSYHCDQEYPLKTRYAVETYLNKECTELHCNKIRRSFDDLFILVKTYYPWITPKTLFKRILLLPIKGTHKYKDLPLLPQLVNCSTMERNRIIYTFSYDSHEIGLRQIKANNPNNNMTMCNSTEINCDKYNSKYSWIDLLNMIGIKYQENEQKTQELLYEYIMSRRKDV